MSASVDVLVVGLGPAGAATAIRLAQAGIRVRAIDRATFPREKTCSEYLSPETVRQLAQLGVLDRVGRAGAPLKGASVIGPGGARLTGLFGQATPSEPPALGLSVARRILDHALVEQARAVGVDVQEGTSLVALDRTESRPRAMIRSAGGLATTEAAVVVGADGLHSIAAKSLGERRHGWPRRYGFVAHVADVAEMGDTAEMHVGLAGYVGLNRIGAGLTNVAVVVPQSRARAASGDAEGFWFDTLQQFPGVRGRVDRHRIAREVRVAGPFAVRSSRVIGPGLLLVGDAADFFDPFTGEGVNAALRGAELAAPILTRALRTGLAVDTEALAEYPAARRGAFGGKWIVERLIGYGMHAPSVFNRAVDRLGRRDLGHTLVGVTGAMLPASRVLRPSFLAAMMV